MAGVQVILIRRALALTGGDEVVYAITLAIWLLTVASGSALGSVIINRVEKLVHLTPAVIIALSVSILIAPITLVISARLFSWIPGTVPGGWSITIPMIVSLLPVGIFGGMLFPLFCRVAAQTSGSRIAVIYLLEASGAFAAGLAVTLIFAPRLSGLTMVLFFAIIGVTAAATLLYQRFRFWFSPVIALVAAIAATPSLHNLDIAVFSSLRPGIELKEILETPYGLIEITETQGQVTIYENGLLLAVSDDPAGDEERAHIPLVQHPAPRTVLWIGGSLGNGVSEALQHPSVKRFDLVEVNAALFDLQSVFNPTGNDYHEDGRITRHRGDGRAFLAKSRSDSYDVIVLNLPGPRTARLAKYYTVEAFQIIKRALKPGGVLVFPVQSSEDYIGKDLAELLGSLQETCRSVFDSVAVLPGGNAFFVAGDLTIEPALSADIMQQRLQSRDIDPLYWDSYRLRDRLSPDRKRALYAAIKASSSPAINHDAAPICFYMQQILWSRQVRGGFADLLKALKPITEPVLLILLPVILLFACIARFMMPKRRRVTGAGWALFAVGLSGIALEILALVAYQIHFGSGYRAVGLLMGCYMAGLASGAAISEALKKRRDSIFRWIQAAWGVVPVGLIVLALTPLNEMPVFGALFFFLYLLIIGILGGMHFPLALSFYQRESATRAGYFYALDLGGAALGALAIGLFALPLIGVYWSCLFLAALNLTPFVLISR